MGFFESKVDPPHSFMRRSTLRVSLTFLLAVSLWMSPLDAQETSEPMKLGLKHLHNAIKVREGLISGGSPESSDAFEELQWLGIKTIISVDGAKPDVQMAQRFSMRYIHIPHGYDGISESTLQQLTKAVTEFPGPIYVHCHHGKHRGPAACAAVCVAQGILEPQQARSILELAGTSPSYKGLFRAVAQAKPLGQALLEKLQFEFPSQSDVPPLVDAMVALDQTMNRLEQVAKARWKLKDQDNQVDIAHESVLLREHFEEMQRLDDLSNYSAAFRQMLKESERSAWFIESMLHSISKPSELKPIQRKALEINWNSIRANCTACHKQFRDPSDSTPEPHP